MEEKLIELKEKILDLYYNFQEIDKKSMNELEKLFPIDVPNGINKEDVYILLLNNDFNISVEKAIHYIRLKEIADKEIERMLF